MKDKGRGTGLTAQFLFLLSLSITIHLSSYFCLVDASLMSFPKPFWNLFSVAGFPAELMLGRFIYMQRIWSNPASAYS